MAGLDDGAKKFAALAKALREAGDGQLQKELYSGINRAVKPLTAAVKKSTPQFLPRRYAFELAKSLRVKARNRRDGVTLLGAASTKRGKERDLASLNRGRLRHPLYGNRGFWYDQKVKPNWWDDPLLQGADEVREEIEQVLDGVARKIEKNI